MTYKELLRQCKTVEVICREFGVTHQAVYKWRKTGKVPPLRVYEWREKVHKLNGETA